MSNLIGFIGVGNMGNPMVDQLIKAGEKIKVYDVSSEALNKAREMNFDIARNIDEVVAEASTIITMLPESKHSRNVYLGEKGILNKASKN